MAGSIPVHLRHTLSPQGEIRALGRPRFALRIAGGRVRPNRLRSFGLDDVRLSGQAGSRLSPQGEIRALGRPRFALRAAGGRVRPNRLRSFGLVLVATMAALVLVAGPAGASAQLLSSSPNDGDSLAALELITFEFDSLLIPAGAEITVTKLDGTTVPVGPTTVDGAALSATVLDPVPSGNYSVAYSVQSADGDLNTGAIRVAVNAPDQALSGGLIAVVSIAVAMLSYLAFVFRADQRRRRR